MAKATDDAANKVHSHREDGEEAIKKISKVVPIDGGAKEQSVENISPDPNRSGPTNHAPSSEVFDDFLEGIKDRNVANRKKGIKR